MLRCRLVPGALALTLLVSSECAFAEFNAENPVYSLPYNDPKWSVLWTALGVTGSLLLTRADPPGPGWKNRGRGFVTTSTTWLQSIHSDHTDVWGGQLMYGRYARTWLSLGLEGSALGLRDTRIRTGATSGSLIARWHLLTEPSASLFFESGVGLVYFSSAFPPSGTKLNFAPMYGLGSLIHLRDGVDLRLGVRHQHFSNAGVLGGGNPGFDSNGVIIGFQFRLDGAAGEP
jgi:hypothetical protein